MAKFNIDHTVNQTPGIYDLRSDLEGLEIQISNLYHDFNKALTDYFSINKRYYYKNISREEMELLESFKKRHIKKVEDAFESQNEFFNWINNLADEVEVLNDKS